MSRPCQRRRESAAAQRRSKPNPKPAGPPPIRHKARQKAIHNARRGQTGTRGGDRGGGRGGKSGRNQGRGNVSESNQDFITSAKNGNNFNLLHGAGSRDDPIALDDNDSLDGMSISYSDSEEDSDTNLQDSIIDGTEALTINVEVNSESRGRPKRATVMFPMVEALRVYRGLWQAGFPLAPSTKTRFAIEAPLFIEDLQPSAYPGLSQYSQTASGPDIVSPPKPSASSRSSYISPTSAFAPHQPSTNTAINGASTTRPSIANSAKARDYIFDWGVHSGKHFSQVPESYLRTIGGNPLLLDRHSGIKEAFDYHRPGMRRTRPTEKQMARALVAPVQATSKGRMQGSRANAKSARPVRKSWTTFTFPSGAHANKKLNEVPENYLRMIEGMADVVNKWVGLKDALLDFNAKTGRQGKTVP